MLTLRPCHPNDCADFIAMEQDPQVMRYLNGGAPVDRSQTDGTFLTPDGTEQHLWTARRTETDAFVGWFCLWPDSPQVAELGYRLARSAWGQGLATEGAKTLIHWGFTQARYDMIYASTMAVNLASRRVMEKAGLTYARTVHANWPTLIPGSDMGEVIYQATNPNPRSML